MSPHSYYLIFCSSRKRNYFFWNNYLLWNATRCRRCVIKVINRNIRRGGFCNRADFYPKNKWDFCPTWPLPFKISRRYSKINEQGLLCVPYLYLSSYNLVSLDIFLKPIVDAAQYIEGYSVNFVAKLCFSISKNHVWDSYPARPFVPFCSTYYYNK